LRRAGRTFSGRLLNHHGTETCRCGQLPRSRTNPDVCGPGLIIATAVGLFRIHRFEGRGARAVRTATLIAVASWVTGFGSCGHGGFLPRRLLAGLLPGRSSRASRGVLAFAVAGAGPMWSRVLPAWSGALAVLTSLLLFGFNAEDDRILFVVPFGGRGWSWAASCRLRRVITQHKTARRYVLSMHNTHCGTTKD
jgi:hypothetical protein